MSNILFIGPTRQQDGWGVAAKGFIEALKHTGHNLTIRPIYMSAEADKASYPDYDRLENNIYGHYDVVIQNALPHLFDYNANFGLNVGLADFETSNLNRTSWLNRCKLMDQIWVNTTSELNMLLSADINAKKINQPIDVNKFYTQDQPIGLGTDDYVFYFVGELIERKNLESLIRAFHTEFHRNEPVSLLIKSSGNAQDIGDYINQIKSKMRLYSSIDKYKPEIVITQRLSDTDLYRLHKACHCFVMPSRGESACLPALDALGFGKQVIGVNNTGTADLEPGGATIIPSYTDRVYTSNPPLADLYTGYENWQEIRVVDLMWAMRDAYRTRKDNPLGFDYVTTNHSYDFVAQQINQCIQ